MSRFAAVFCLFVSIHAVAGKSRKDVPIAPLPAIIGNAHTVFLANAGGSELAYDAFYSEIQKWGRYQIVGSPAEADLIVELGYRVDKGGTRKTSASREKTG